MYNVTLILILKEKVTTWL